ncbi:MAG: hypothetical protein ACYC8S_00625 [Minisyncoccota bacterium]
MTEEVKKETEKISRHKFFFELPLYTPINISDLEKEFSYFFHGDVDAYSPDGFDTTYTISRLNLGSSDSTYNGYSALSLVCKRKGNTLESFIYKTDETITKVGQFLSLADLQYAEIGKRYDKVLSGQDLHDLKKAIGLMAHGAGAGSLVYLRRIFENIIWDTYGKHKGILGISDEEFRKKRMDEKVDCLKGYLPSQLVEMKGIYGILSKGVHELSEEECLAYFPALKLSIILILDQRIEEDVKSKRDADTKKAVADIAKQINGK